VTIRSPLEGSIAAELKTSGLPLCCSSTRLKHGCAHSNASVSPQLVAVMQTSEGCVYSMHNSKSSSEVVACAELYLILYSPNLFACSQVQLNSQEVAVVVHDVVLRKLPSAIVAPGVPGKVHCLSRCVYGNCKQLVVLMTSTKRQRIATNAAELCTTYAMARPL
jgi:hypothetical protein